MKKNIIVSVVVNLVLVVLLTRVMIQQGDLDSRLVAQQEKIDKLRIEQEENVLITQVVRICNSGRVQYHLLSLTSQGWLDFMRTCPGAGCTFSNFKFEDLFTFIEINPDFPDEVIEFLETEKTTAVGVVRHGYDGEMKGRSFFMSYRECSYGIELLFYNNTDELEVKYVFWDACHVKQVFVSETTTNYLVFEDKDSNVIAIKIGVNDEIKMYQLAPINVSE